MYALCHMLADWSVNMNTLYPEFKQFVNNQPADRVIDHHMWYTCAIGDFAYCTNKVPEDWSWSVFAEEVCFGVIHNETHGHLFDILNTAECKGLFPNYGELATYLNECEARSTWKR